MLDENKTKNKILQAGLKLINQGGYGSLSISAVAMEAKISKQSLFYHYSDMQELFFDLVKIWSRTGQECTIEVLAKQNTGGLTRVNSIIDGMFLWIERYPEVSKLGLSMFQSGPHIRKIKKFMDEARDIARGRLKEILICDPKINRLNDKKLNELITGIHTIMYGSFLYICAMNDFANLANHHKNCLNNINQLLKAAQD